MRWWRSLVAIGAVAGVVVLAGCGSSSAALAGVESQPAPSASLATSVVVAGSAVPIVPSATLVPITPTPTPTPNPTPTPTKVVLPKACKFLTVAQINKLFDDGIYDLSGSEYPPLGCEYDMYSEDQFASDFQTDMYIRFTWYPRSTLPSATKLKQDGYSMITVHGHAGAWQLENSNAYFTVGQLEVKINGGVLIISVQADPALVSGDEMKSFLGAVFAQAAPHVG